MNTENNKNPNKAKEKITFNINLQNIMLEEIFSNEDLEKIIMNKDILSMFFPMKNTNTNENNEIENIKKIEEEFEFIEKQTNSKLCLLNIILT
jgi:hypothetical protein